MMRESMSGDKSPTKRPEVREKMHNSAVKRWADPTERERQRQLITGDKNMSKRPEVREKMRLAGLGNQRARKHKRITVEELRAQEELKIQQKRDKLELRLKEQSALDKRIDEKLKHVDKK